MIITTKQIRGKGRGKVLGFPTINLAIPEKIDLKDGIYASLVKIHGKEFIGALFFGSIPTFGEDKKSLEVFLINAIDFNLNDDNLGMVELNIGKRIRDVIKFDSIDELKKQMAKDVEAINQMLSDIIKR